MIAHARANASGQFQLDAPRTFSSRDDVFMAVALAPGYGVGWADMDADADQPAGEISLQGEQLIEGRLLDLPGRPAKGVVVSVGVIQRGLAQKPSGRLQPRRPDSEGPAYWSEGLNDLPAWPKPATTDSEGRFTLHGVGRGCRVVLNIVDPRYAREIIELETDNAPGVKVVSSTLRPAQVITGRVTYADTGEGVSRALVEILARDRGRGVRSTSVQADADGRFRTNPCPGDRFSFYTSPPPGRPYLSIFKQVDWPKGAIEQTVDLALPRGVMMRGQVSEEGSGRPVAGALVHFHPFSPAASLASGGGSGAEATVDGTFELAVPPGPGHLSVLAASDDYVLHEMGNRKYFSGRGGGFPLYSHSFVVCDPQPGGPVLDLHVALRRGATIAGRVIGPDGKLVHSAWIIGRAALAPSVTSDFRSWEAAYHGVAMHGRFELHGIDSDVELPVHFFDPKRRLAATVRLSGKAGEQGMTVRLEPCGAATARLVDPTGRPIAGHGDDYLVQMTITPESKSPQNDQPVPRYEPLFLIDPINYARPPASDSQGRITFPALIPGASYRVSARTKGAQPAKDFTVKPGETVDLGDIAMEKPPAEK